MKELLLRGYRIRGTARDPADSKNAHLLALDGAEERLTLCRADLLNYDSLRAAFAGCNGVFHACLQRLRQSPARSSLAWIGSGRQWMPRNATVHFIERMPDLHVCFINFSVLILSESCLGEHC